MQKIINVFLAFLTTAGLITVWIIIPIMGLFLTTGFISSIVYYAIKDHRETAARKKADSQTNQVDYKD